MRFLFVMKWKKYIYISSLDLYEFLYKCSIQYQSKNFLPPVFEEIPPAVIRLHELLHYGFIIYSWELIWKTDIRQHKTR